MNVYVHVDFNINIKNVTINARDISVNSGPGSTVNVVNC